MAAGFVKYLEKRGYNPEAGSTRFLWRLFFESWAQPGFHRFWQVWNPGYGYFLFKLYLALGGRRRPVAAGLVVFLSCGLLLHDFPLTLITGRGFILNTIAFTFWAILAMVFKWSERLLRLETWPWWIHVLLNMGLIVAGLMLGGRMQGMVWAN